ncbi:MAG: orotate phosphoribosyltransferase [Acidobacteriota bacterium]|nr:MAG: orotate phosphoribosyltransferase [Acidobacteriota bacterium]
MNDSRERLLEILREKSLKIGTFKLVSGMTSHYYFDSKFTTLDAEGSYLTSLLLLEELAKRNVKAVAIGGLTLGADPIVSAVAAVSWVERKRFDPLAAFIVRKETKQHGTMRFIEGFTAEPNTPVIIVDDVCTTGGSTLKAIKRTEEAGYKVVAVVCLVDRQQGGAEALSDYPFFPLFTAEELLAAPEIQKQLAALTAAEG